MVGAQPVTAPWRFPGGQLEAAAGSGDGSPPLVLWW